MWVPEGLHHAGYRAIHELRLIDIRHVARLDEALDAEEADDVRDLIAVDAKGEAEAGNRQEGREHSRQQDANDDFFLLMFYILFREIEIIKDRNTG